MTGTIKNLIICDYCWDHQNDLLTTHRCQSDIASCTNGILCPEFMVDCHCPCDEVPTQYKTLLCTHQKRINV